MRDEDIVDALLTEFGRTYAEEVGIDVASQRPGELFRLLTMALVFSTGINHELTLRSAEALRPYKTARQLADVPWQELRAVLGAAHVQRTTSTAHRLHDAAVLALERYDGDLRRLREEADGDVAELTERLQDFKGIGETGTEVFLREVQVAWPEVRPFLDARAQDTAERLGLSRSAERLAGLVGEERIAVVAAALIRASFDDGVDRVRAAAA